MGRALLRRLAAEALAIPPDAVLLAHDPAGRPIVAAPAGADLRCSVTHAGGAVAAAVTIGCMVGVDVEPVDARRADLATVTRYLDVEEAERLAALPPAEQTRAAALAWTRLEAEAKGRGLALDRLRGRAPGGIATELELGPDHVGTLWTDREATIHRADIERTGG